MFLYFVVHRICCALENEINDKCDGIEMNQFATSSPLKSVMKTLVLSDL